MLSVSKPSSHQVDVELSGPVDADNMRSALNRLIEGADGMLHGKMLYKVSDLALPSMAALAVEFQLLPKLFGLVGRFDKCAVLSDAAWIRRSAEIKGAVIPFLEIKGFPMSDQQRAQAWLDGVDDEDLEDVDENYPV